MNANIELTPIIISYRVPGRQNKQYCLAKRQTNQNPVYSVLERKGSDEWEMVHMGGIKHCTEKFHEYVGQYYGYLN